MNRFIQPLAIGAEFEGQLVIANDDWTRFAASWGRLLPDTYMADGGRYRYRRYSEFDYNGVTGVLVRRIHVPYMQSKVINHLNGGLERLYEPLEPAVVESGSFRQAVQQGADLARTASGHDRWLVQCFQNRITATSSESGQPAPEGPHRDGVDFVLTLLVARHNVIGGASQIYDLDRNLISSRELEVPGEYIVLDDNARLHGVTPITPAVGDSGHRDVLILMYTADSEAAR